VSRVAFHFGGEVVEAGTRRSVELPIGTLTDHTPVRLPVHIVHGRRAGPTVLVCAAIHGDEIVGVEIIRRLLGQAALGQLRGTLMAVPIVNAFGFLGRSRYLPDRRDLNRCFPGNENGSLASRLANTFLSQVVARADLAIDLHSAAVHRTNLPQIRINPNQRKVRDLAVAFGAPVFMASRVLEGSLREAAAEIGVDTLLYEAGEALRFDEPSVRVGLRGILRVMRSLEMLPACPTRSAQPISTLSRRVPGLLSGGPSCRSCTRATRCFTLRQSDGPTSQASASKPTTPRFKMTRCSMMTTKSSE